MTSDGAPALPEVTRPVEEEIADLAEPIPPEPGSVNLEDGLKLLLEGGSRILVRESGTEPVARLYVEARSEKDRDALSQAGRELF